MEAQAAQFVQIYRLIWVFNPTALRKAKIVCNFGLSECNRVNILTGLQVYGSNSSFSAIFIKGNNLHKLTVCSPGQCCHSALKSTL